MDSSPTELTGEPYRVIGKLLNIDCKVAQSCDPMDCSPSGSSVHGIFQARILEWVAISLFRGSSWPRDWTQFSHIAGRLYRLSHKGIPIDYVEKKKKKTSQWHLFKQFNEKLEISSMNILFLTSGFTCEMAIHNFWWGLFNEELLKFLKVTVGRKLLFTEYMIKNVRPFYIHSKMYNTWNYIKRT